MASKRKLKKQVAQLAVQLYEEAILLHSLSTPEVAEQVDTLIDELIVFTDDTLRRIHKPDGKDTPALVRAYYRKLRSDIATKEQDFNERLTAFITAE